MKQVHNFRARIISLDKAMIEAAFEKLQSDAGYKREEATLTLKHDEDTTYDTFWIGELWIENQQPLRKIMRLLNERLSAEDKNNLKENASRFIDISTHCFFRLNIEALLADQYELAVHNDSMHIRLNIAAFPATKDNAIKVLRELF